MTVYDTGRETPYDFQYQSAYYACQYDVVWRTLLLRMKIYDAESYRRAMSIAQAYLGGPWDENEQMLRFIRVSVWVRRAAAPPGFFDDLDTFKFELFLDYRDLKQKLYPGRSKMGNFLMWDWHVVRKSLRNLFAQDPGTFADMRRDVHITARHTLQEERNYFIWLCDEETYVR